LNVKYYCRAPNLTWNAKEKRGSPFNYFVSGSACSEVEVDCLTGEYQIHRTDIVMDVGKSLNPAIDLGQIEGAFMQGVGLFTLEEMVYDDFGNLLTNGTSTYKIPTALDIPLEFNVSFLTGSSNPRAIYSSKSVGEPPLILANSVYFAIKDAVRVYRKQIGLDTKFKMDSPATVEKVLDACNDVYETLIV
jgi:xanthine dehydrogenase/oxidase